MKIGILSTDQLNDDRRLLAVAKHLGHEVRTLKLSLCSISLAPGEPVVFYGDEVITRSFDVIIPRINVAYTERGLRVLQQFWAAGVNLTDHPEAIAFGRDKLKCLQLLMRDKLPFPRTAIAFSSNCYQRVMRDFNGAPLVLKLLQGTEGAGVFLAHTEKEVINLLLSFDQLGAPVLIQEYIEESAGEDIRSFVIGDTIVASMQRNSQDGDFRANVSLGGSSKRVDLTEDERRVVLEATRCMGINIAGVDFVRSRRGPLLLEINVSPDFTGEHGIEKATGCDIAGAIVDFAVQRCSQPLLAGPATPGPAAAGPSLASGLN